MAKTETCVNPSNMYFATDKKLNNNENRSYSSHSFSSQINEHSWEFSNNKLPLKKRCGSTFDNANFNFMKQPDTENNPWIQKRQNMNNSTAEKEGHLQKPEARLARILPGVIRHTSCPDRSLAYYYNYSVN